MSVIALLNESTVVSDAELAAIAAASSHQLRYHVSRYWGSTVHSCVAVPKGGASPTGAWPHHIMDDSDQPGALGYHEDQNGLPNLYSFAKTDQRYGLSLSVTITHENNEAAADKDCQRGEQDQANGFWYALELGDPVEADTDGYTIDVGGVPILVSNFILPSWFGGGTPTESRFDYNRVLTKPYEVRPGGYVAYWDGAWHQFQQQESGLVEVPLEPGNPRYRAYRRILGAAPMILGAAR